MLEAIMSCEVAAKRASRAQEEALGVIERMLLRSHLMMCDGCTNFTRRLEFLRMASQALPSTFDDEN